MRRHMHQAVRRRCQARGEPAAYMFLRMALVGLLVNVLWQDRRFSGLDFEAHKIWVRAKLHGDSPARAASIFRICKCVGTIGARSSRRRNDVRDDVEMKTIRGVLDRVLLRPDWAYKRYDAFTLRPHQNLVTTVNDRVFRIFYVGPCRILRYRDSPLCFTRSVALLSAFVVQPELPVAYEQASIIGVAPGNYTLEVAKAGFGTAHQTAVTLYVNQTAAFDFALNVGSVAQTVTVSAAAAQLETSTANLGTVFSSSSVGNLPLNGRNFPQLLTLAPGSSGVNTSQSAGGGINAVFVGSTTFPAVNGQWNRSNMFLLDGIIDQQFFGSEYAVPPIVDAIKEFKLQSHNDQSQFGGVMGGVVNVVTKSGTNGFHGNAWEFLRNDALDAKNPLLQKKTPLKQSVYGATIGGPVIAPFYNGRDRTFFFGAYEGTSSNSAAERFYNVPTAAELNGDFSAIPQQLYDPFSTTPDPAHPGQYLRTPFPGNNISARLNPNAVLLAKDIFPAAVPLVNGFNGVDTSPSRARQHDYSLRLDEQLTQSNLIWGRFSAFHVTTSASGGFAGLVTNQKANGQNWTVSYIHVFGASATLQLQAGHVWQYYQNISGFSNAPANLIPDSGFSQNFACGYVLPPSCKLPILAIPGYLSGGNNNGNATDSNAYEFKADFTKLLGNHIIAFGADTVPHNEHVGQSNGNIAFSSFQTSNLQSSANTGDALASYMIGVPVSGVYRNQLKDLIGGNISDFYVQDQWKLTPKLTMNWGFRYDLVVQPGLGPNPTKSNFTGAYDFNTGEYLLTKNAGALGSCASLGAPPCIPTSTLPAHVVILNTNKLIGNQYDNFQPRIGLAYQVNPTLVLHASYGRVYDTWSASLQSAQNEGSLWPSVSIQQAANLNSSTVTALSSDPIGLGTTGKILPAATPFNQVAFFIDPHIKNPYSDQWMAGIQHQLDSATVLTLDYVGSTTKRLPCCGWYNVAQSPGPGTPQLRAPFPYIVPTHYDRSVGAANYNALQAQLKRQVSSGLQYTFNYTWSKAMNMGCDGAFGVEGCFVRNPYKPEIDRSVAGFDLTNIFTATVLYQLPFGKGQRFSTNSRFTNAVMGGWQLNAIANLRSGAPYTISYSGDRANTGNGFQGVDIVGNPNVASPTRAHWFNTAAFQAPAQYTYGSVGRNTMRSQAFRNVDLSLFRTITIERFSTEFRAEAFNALNNVVYAAPGATQNSNTFGVVSGTASAQRVLQLALKLSF